MLVNAHGGFAVDRRPGKDETYFALPGAGILQISSDLKTINLLDTPDEMRKVNLHDTNIWYDKDGTPYLVFPANNEGKIFTTSLDGKLVHKLDAPTAADNFEQPEVHDYFLGGGNFSPTAVEYLEGLYYVTTGYCNLDYVLTARVTPEQHFEAVWNDLAWGGKVTESASSAPGMELPSPPGKCGSTSRTGPTRASNVSPVTATTFPACRCLRVHCPATSITWTRSTAWCPRWKARISPRARLSTSWKMKNWFRPS